MAFDDKANGRLWHEKDTPSLDEEVLEEILMGLPELRSLTIRGFPGFDDGCLMKIAYHGFQTLDYLDASGSRKLTAAGIDEFAYVWDMYSECERDGGPPLKAYFSHCIRPSENFVPEEVYNTIELELRKAPKLHEFVLINQYQGECTDEWFNKMDADDEVRNIKIIC